LEHWDLEFPSPSLILLLSKGGRRFWEDPLLNPPPPFGRGRKKVGEGDNNNQIVTKLLSNYR